MYRLTIVNVDTGEVQIQEFEEYETSIHVELAIEELHEKGNPWTVETWEIIRTKR